MSNSETKMYALQSTWVLFTTQEYSLLNHFALYLEFIAETNFYLQPQIKGKCPLMRHKDINAYFV